MKFFESEIEEGFRNNICLICNNSNCKHLQRWRVRNKIGIPKIVISLGKEQKNIPKHGIKINYRGAEKHKIGSERILFEEKYKDTRAKAKKGGEKKKQIEQARLNVGKGVVGWRKPGIITNQVYMNPCLWKKPLIPAPPFATRWK